MTSKLIDYKLLTSFNSEFFTQNDVFPWYNLQGFLTQEAFDKLYKYFPSVDFFEKHEGIKRPYAQRPHNRYYLAYEQSIYNQGESRQKGAVKLQDLPEVWQALIEELETSQEYKDFIQSLFSVTEYRVRYAWHMGVTNSEVSPHRDDTNKIGTHILYFNTSQDWNPDWGGSILVLGDKQTETMNPDFADFSKIKTTQILDNHSFIFKNTPDAWHGVKPLSCPEGKYRRLFNIVFDFPGSTYSIPKTKQTSLPKKLLSKAISSLRG